MSDRICVECGGPLTTPDQRKYCSRQCVATAQTIDKEIKHCEQCGKQLGRCQSRFCSRDCYSTFVIEQNTDEPLRAAITKLWDDGLTLVEIGRRVRLTKNAVAGKVHRWGLPTRRLGPAPSGPEMPSIKTPFFVHTDRITEGSDPLRPMHSISWGAIAL